jgi:hypothetical protein
MLSAVGRAGDEELAVLLLDADVAGHALRQLALWALDPHELRFDRDLDAVGDGDRLLADARHRYQTLATSSPPTPARRAS